MNCQMIEQKNPLLVQNGYRLIDWEEGMTDNPIQYHRREIWQRFVNGTLMQLERWLTDGMVKNSKEYPANSDTARIRRSRVLPQKNLMSA